MKELEQRRATETSLSSSSSSLLTSKIVVSPESIQDVKELLALNALTVDVEPGTRLTRYIFVYYFYSFLYTITKPYSILIDHK